MERQGRSLAIILGVAAVAVVVLGAVAFANGLPPGGTFIDDNGNIHEANIEAIAAEGITKGCNPSEGNTRYCPASSVTRGQMAAFLARALALAPTDVDFFVDDDESVFEGDINRLAAAGITKGCNPSEGNTKFCPDVKVTREVMAAFLVRAFGYSDDGGGDLFIDDDGSIFEGDIDRLGTAGVTKGCNPSEGNTRYCPKSLVLRDQMASFLARALNLAPIQPPPATTSTTVTTTTGAKPSNPGDAVNCDDFTTWAVAQAWFDFYYPYYGDVAKLDADNNLIACESLPGAP